jgi:hypothetical protein
MEILMELFKGAAIAAATIILGVIVFKAVQKILE